MNSQNVRLTLQIAGEMPEEKRFELVGFLEAKLQEVLKLPTFEFGENEVTQTPSRDDCVRVTLLCETVGGIDVCKLSQIMHDLSYTEIVSGHYGVSYPSPNSVRLVPLAA